MERRNFLKAAAAFTLGVGAGAGYTYQKFGWRPPSKPSVSPRFYEKNQAAVGKGEGRVSQIYKYYQTDRKKALTPFFQTGSDCTSQASGMGIELVEILQHLFKQSRYEGQIATEMLHVGARSIIGGRTSGGVAVNETVKFIQDYGVLFRKDYGVMDFTEYDYNKNTELTGQIPEVLLEECKKHQVKTATLVSSWVEARDAIASLQPIIIGSMVGFEPKSHGQRLTRDAQGFVKPNGQYAHAWLLIGVDDRERKGGCLLSSWGKNWVKGPKGHGQPDGSIWIDKEVLELMLTEYGDSYAINTLTNLDKADYRLWK